MKIYLNFLGSKYFKKACDKNDNMACHYLSSMYISGVPKNLEDFNPHDPEKNKNIEYAIKPDFKEAFKYASKACELGHVYGCANVSIMYAKGEGVEKNEELAEKFKKITIELQRAPETTKELKFQQGLNNKK